MKTAMNQLIFSDFTRRVETDKHGEFDQPYSVVYWNEHQIAKIMGPSEANPHYSVFVPDIGDHQYYASFKHEHQVKLFVTMMTHRWYVEFMRDDAKFQSVSDAVENIFYDMRTKYYSKSSIVGFKHIMFHIILDDENIGVLHETDDDKFMITLDHEPSLCVVGPTTADALWFAALFSLSLR